jgi:hypothetical protein
MPATSSSKKDSMTARNSTNANNSISINRDANRAGMPETVWKPTTHEFLQKFTKNSSERQTFVKKTIKEQKLSFLFLIDFSQSDGYRTIGSAMLVMM